MIAAQTAEMRFRTSQTTQNFRSTSQTTRSNFSDYVPKYHSSTSGAAPQSTPMELGQLGVEQETEAQSQPEHEQDAQAQLSFIPRQSLRVPTKMTHAKIMKLRQENRCFFCEQVGHMKHTCPKLKGGMPKKE
jgi:hypothetical protein